jgi:hypothetical protein
MEDVKEPTEVTWNEFEADAPGLAATARARLEQPGVVLVVTIRADGTPRLSPVEPFFWDGELWLPLLFESKKVADLRRDARVLVHSIVTTRDGDEGEIKVRGRAHKTAGVRRQAVCRAIGDALPFQPDPDRLDLFRTAIESVTHILYVDGDQHVTMWPRRTSFVRRITSATSLGEPENITDY